MAQQTAVEWLIDNWIKFNDIDIELDDFANLRPLLEQAKQMEKEQRNKDYNAGYMDAQCNHINDCENYGNEQDYAR